MAGLLDGPSPDFGQLLRDRQFQDTMNYLGSAFGALFRKARGDVGIQMPQMRERKDPLDLYFRHMQIKQMQDSMKSKRQDRELDAADREKRLSRESAIQGALLGVPGETSAQVDQRTGRGLLGLDQYGGAPPGQPGVTTPGVRGLLDMEGIDPRRSALARALTLGGEYGDAIKMATPQSYKAPTTRDFNISGGLLQTRQFDPETGQWGDVGDPTQRWRPSERGGVTPTQSANNIEIDSARRQLEELAANLPPGVSLRDEVIRRGSRQSDTGMPNADYNPMILRAWNAANQRKVGNDPGYERFLSLGTTAAPEPLSVDEPPAEPEPPGLFDRALGYFGFGDDEAVPATAPNTNPRFRGVAPAMPPTDQSPASATRTRGSLTPGGARDVPLMADNLVDVKKLRKGRIYRIPSPDGGFDMVRWNGKSFEAVK